jgi:hypothetical protein
MGIRIYGSDVLQDTLHLRSHADERLTVRTDEAGRQFSQDLIRNDADVFHPQTVETRKR